VCEKGALKEKRREQLFTEWSKEKKTVVLAKSTRRARKEKKLKALQKKGRGERVLFEAKHGLEKGKLSGSVH